MELMLGPEYHTRIDNNKTRLFESFYDFIRQI
jgi:hypothetical protein